MATTVESLRKAVGKKQHSLAFAWLADLMRQNGDLDAALTCVQTGLSVTPTEEGNLVLSKILVEMQDWDGVIEACEFVLSRNPYCLSALRRLGDAYAEKGDEEKRNLYYRLLHDLDPLDAFWKEEYAPKIEISEDVPPLDNLAEPEPALAEEPSPVASQEDSPVECAEKKTEEEKDEDPFSSLATLLPADEDTGNEVSFHELENSLDKAIADFSPANTEKDVFPTEEIDGDDISTALSGIFGVAETEEAANEKTEEKNAETPSVEKNEDKPQSLSDAFDSIFGEDELPEEFVLSKPKDNAVKENAPTAEIPASEASPALDKAPLTSAAPSETADASPLFDKSMSMAPPQPSGSLEKSVESSFDSLFGDASDDLPLEGLAGAQKPDPEPAAHPVPSDEPSASLETASPSPSVPPQPSGSLEKSVESSFDSLFGDASDDLPLEGLAGAQKPDAESAAHPVPSDESSASLETASPFPSVPPQPSGSLEKSVESSFDSLFGDASDDLPLEGLAGAQKPDPESAAHPVPSDESSASLETASPSPSVPPQPSGSLEKSVESSFDSLFGDASDDALVEDPTTSTRTLAEIYFEQGVYDEAVKIYRDLLRKTPDDESLKRRLSEIEKIRDDKKEN